jgi:hypothetical protein
VGGAFVHKETWRGKEKEEVGREEDSKKEEKRKER